MINRHIDKNYLIIINITWLKEFDVTIKFVFICVLDAGFWAFAGDWLKAFCF